MTSSDTVFETDRAAFRKFELFRDDLESRVIDIHLGCFRRVTLIYVANLHFCGFGIETKN